VDIFPEISIRFSLSAAIIVAIESTVPPEASEPAASSILFL